MPIAPNQCTVFIQVWVDVNFLRAGTTSGCYAFCNRSQDSTGQGTANLTTPAIAGSNVCWAVLPIDPQYQGHFSITEIGPESGWATLPAPVPGMPHVFTGQLTASTAAGSVNSSLQFSFNKKGSSAAVTLDITFALLPVSERKLPERLPIAAAEEIVCRRISVGRNCWVTQ